MGDPNFATLQKELRLSNGLEAWETDRNGRCDAASFNQLILPRQISGNGKRLWQIALGKEPGTVGDSC